MKFGMSFFRILYGFLALGLVSCTVEDLPELEIQSVSIYADTDANLNSATSVDLVLVYNKELLKTIGKMPAGQYFASSRQLLLDNPTLLDVWRWELVPGQIVAGFTPDQDKGAAYGAYVFANYLTPGDHRVRVAPNGIVKIRLLRDDLRNLETFNTHDMKIGMTMSNVVNVQEGVNEGYARPCHRRLGPVCRPICKKPSISSPPCTQKVRTPPYLRQTAPCLRPGKPIQILTKPLNPPPLVPPKPYTVR